MFIPLHLLGADTIPLASVLGYVRMSLLFDQREVIDLLADRATALATRTTPQPETGVHRQSVSIQLLSLVGAVRELSGRRVTLTGIDSNHGMCSPFSSDI